MKSQNNEEQIIADYFRGIGTVLDIGANDGVTLSNSHGVIAKGWGGTLVEPCKEAFSRLARHYRDNETVCMLPFAIGTETGKAKFYQSGTHLNKGDIGLLSSLKKEETTRWRRERFSEHETEVYTFDDMLAHSSYKTFDLITIDAEGMDYEILSQIDLKAVGCKMLIVEWNSKEKDKYVAYCAKYGMKLHAENHENLIFTV